MEFNVSVIGYLAGICSAISQFPQALRIIKTGDTASISPLMYSLLTLGVLLWFYYGILLHNSPMIIANGIGLIPSIYILYITFRNKLKANK
ncbi:MAG: SemiSWEET transporter [Paludibacter sp.]|nr:SemiSWEET transporter [Paludibacter sp.]